MTVSHLGGIISCHNYNDLKNALMIRYGAGLNMFIIGSDDDQPYPCLNVGVNNQYANVVYLPNDDSAGFQSLATDINLDLNQNTMFCMGFVTELFECSNEYVISFEKALDAAIEFFQTGMKPTCIEWLEL